MYTIEGSPKPVRGSDHPLSSTGADQWTSGHEVLLSLSLRRTHMDMSPGGRAQDLRVHGIHELDVCRRTAVAHQVIRRLFGRTTISLLLCHRLAHAGAHHDALVDDHVTDPGPRVLLAWLRQVTVHLDPDHPHVLRAHRESQSQAFSPPSSHPCSHILFNSLYASTPLALNIAQE